MTKGYTLLEILVGLVIISVLFAFGYSSFQQFVRRQAIISTVRKINGDLRLYQQYALEGKKPEGCDVLDGYRIRFSSTTYSVYAVCNQTEISIGKENISIPEDFTLSPSPTSAFMFRILGQGTDISASVPFVVFISQNSLNYVNAVKVTSTGDIQDLGPTTTPSPTPYVVPGCNISCLNNNACTPYNLVCYTYFVPYSSPRGNCRNNSCRTDVDCICPTTKP